MMPIDLGKPEKQRNETNKGNVNLTSGYCRRQLGTSGTLGLVFNLLPGKFMYSLMNKSVEY